MKWAFNKLMLWGALLGWVILHSTGEIIKTAKHKGSGVVGYADEDGIVVSSERVSESEYKRQNYANAGLMLGLGIMGWVIVAQTARKGNTSNTTNG